MTKPQPLQRLDQGLFDRVAQRHYKHPGCA
ncbi:hypothetical protein KR100_06040 [Synechococcus sp. KORDI-100]|nr:hypothetical protein KR100_06040 [Synechococcus sp. KORDI-100]